MARRSLKLPELGMLIFMLRGKPRVERLLALLHTVEVEELHTGENGPLRFVGTQPNRQLGERIASTQFLDEDGVLAFVSLYLDQEGELYELDYWKTDDSPLRRIPAF
ncbi:hypothetical protein MTX78_12085 [Hymenobacter tibetensis]|uniref:DUF6984 domain-containing protein n=1 Tax=Hymenobacter tibetensis TaxID=497967 RepID=A0ABY4CSX4_9BACT|nr:hypothetical protein [Hymenobacter tibetensis]UOG72867.1 hypothetical protein MTX78_12085 [Hymenobacter tibetensis]